jgi:hypothetical protein
VENKFKLNQTGRGNTEAIKSDNHTQWDYYRLQYETLKQSLEKKINAK